MQLGGEGLDPGGFGQVDAGVGRLVEKGPVEPFHFAVGDLVLRPSAKRAEGAGALSVVEQLGVADHGGSRGAADIVNFSNGGERQSSIGRHRCIDL